VRRLPLLLVVFAVAFNAWTLRAERIPVSQLNDGAMHTQMIRWAADRVDAGHSPLDGWYPYFALGSAQFHHYPSLPHVALSPLEQVADSKTIYSVSLYILLCLWPLMVYLGARGFGLERWSAACAALLAPLLTSAPGYGFEYGSYTWQGLGLYSQLWGMVALPLAWRFGWSALERGGRMLGAGAALLALTIALNYQAGYLALACVVLWTLIVPRGEEHTAGAWIREALKRLWRGIVVIAGALLGAAWVLVPLVSDGPWTNLSPAFAGDFWLDSFGAARALEWLLSGELFDAGRLPVLTVLAAIGIVSAFARGPRTRGAIAVTVAGLASLLLFFGRVTWGPLADLLPGGEDLMFPRFLGGIQLAGVMLAGAGLAWLVRLVASRATNLVPARWAAVTVTALLAAVVVMPALVERSRYHDRGRPWIEEQRMTDQAEGGDIARLGELIRQGGGRAYAGSRTNWGEEYLVGRVPMYAQLADQDVDAIGFTYRTISSLSSDVEALFDESDPDQYDLLNIRYLVLPPDRQPAVPARPVGNEGRHVLWEVETSGYLRVVDTADFVTTDRAHLDPVARQALTTYDAEQPLLLTVMLTDEEQAGPTTNQAPGMPGDVVQEVALPEEGRFVAAVEMNRPAVLMLKTSYHPRWEARVDGVTTRPFMVAPSFMGVSVPAGTHSVEFRYTPFQHHGPLMLLGAVAIGLLVLTPEMTRLGRRFRRNRVLGGRASGVHSIRE
jgi:hypothetical protein